MRARLRLWRIRIKQHRVVIIIVAVALAMLIALIISGYWISWTGFNGYIQVTTAHTISRPLAGTVVSTEVYQPGKALWDWLQLLIIPVMLAIGGFWFNRIQADREQRVTRGRAKREKREAAERAEIERYITQDNQREAALQAYIDKMSELLLEKNLRNSVEKDEVRNIARVRTLAVLPRLDASRKGSILRFLYDSHLIDKDKVIIILAGYADLKGADLRGAYLREAQLIGVDLSDADLNNADLSRADLSYVDLSRAKMKEAQLGFAHAYKANFNGANLNSAFLASGEFVEADFRGADLRNADLIAAKLFGADLRGADLREADFGNTALEKANLEGADLREAGLWGATLSGAKLKGANLKGAKGYNEEQLYKASSLEGAIMPDGRVYDFWEH